MCAMLTVLYMPHLALTVLYVPYLALVVLNVPCLASPAEGRGVLFSRLASSRKAQGSKEGSYLRFVDFLYHSTLGRE